MYLVAASLICAFALELFLCIRLDRPVMKLIPVFSVLAVMFMIAMLFTNGTLTGTYGGYSANTVLAAFFFWGVMLVVAMLLAWPACRIWEHFRDKKSREENRD